MPLFAQHLCVKDVPEVPRLPGHFDDQRALRIDVSGTPVAARLGMPTRADRDRPADRASESTGTKAMSDRDDSPALDLAVLLTTKTAGGADRDDDWALLATTTLSGPDRDD